MGTMSLQVLLHCADSELLDMAGAATRRLQVESDVIADVEVAQALIGAVPYDGAILDCASLAQSMELLRAARSNAQQKVIVAVIDGAMTVREACDLGATFVLRRPVTSEALEHTLNAAYGLMLGGRRRHWRCPVCALVEGATRDGLRILGTTVNVSLEGMLLHSGAALGVGSEFKFRLKLPRMENSLAINGRIVWADRGNFGVQFVQLLPSVRDQLCDWIAEEAQHGSTAAARVPQPRP